MYITHVGSQFSLDSTAQSKLFVINQILAAIFVISWMLAPFFSLRDNSANPNISQIFSSHPYFSQTADWGSNSELKIQIKPNRLTGVDKLARMSQPCVLMIECVCARWWRCQQYLHIANISHDQSVQWFTFPQQPDWFFTSVCPLCTVTVDLVPKPRLPFSTSKPTYDNKSDKKCTAMITCSKLK